MDGLIPDESGVARTDFRCIRTAMNGAPIALCGEFFAECFHLGDCVLVAGAVGGADAFV